MENIVPVYRCLAYPPPEVSNTNGIFCVLEHYREGGDKHWANLLMPWVTDRIGVGGDFPDTLMIFSS